MMTAISQASILIQSGFTNSHLKFVAREHDEWEYGEAELQAQDYLAQYQQFCRAAFARNSRHNHGRNDGNQAGDQPAQPRFQTNVEKSFHHDLASESAGERRILAGSQQRDRKESARAGDTE